MNNNSYIYDTKFREEYKEILTQLPLKEKKMEIAVVPDGFIVPPHPSNLPWGDGGVFHPDGSIVDFSKTLGAFGGGSFDFSHAKVMNETVFFCGLLPLHWGHFIIDFICRLWGVIESPQKYRIAYFSRAEDGEISGTFEEFFGLLGIPKERLLKITEITQFDSVIVPEPSMGCAFAFNTEKFNKIISIVKNNALSRASSMGFTCYDKIYYTRLNFSSMDVGEEKIEETFALNGFKTIAPEQYSLVEQIYLLANAKEIATLSGTIPHNFIFASKDTKFIYLNRTPLPNFAQFRINYMYGIQPIWIDVYNKGCLKQNLGHNLGFRIWVEVSNTLILYLKDNNMKIPYGIGFSKLKNLLRYHYIWNWHPYLWILKMKAKGLFHMKN